MGMLENKVAIITGATGGIGFSMAEEFAKEGADIVVVGTNAERGQKAVDAVTAIGKKAFFRKTDLTSTADLQGLVDDTMKEFGRIDILVNNAGADDPISWIPADVTEEEDDRVMAVNTKAPFFLSQKVAPIMKVQGGGAIINTASIASTGAGRAGDPKEIARVAVFLASDDASYLHGAEICPDGGFTLI